MNLSRDPSIHCINIHRTYPPEYLRFSAAILSTQGNNTAITPRFGFRVKIARIASVAIEAFFRVVKVARRYDLLKKVARTINAHRRVHVRVCVCVCLCDVLTPDLTSLTTPRSDPDNYFFSAEREKKREGERESLKRFVGATPFRTNSQGQSPVVNAPRMTIRPAVVPSTRRSL